MIIIWNLFFKQHQKIDGWLSIWGKNPSFHTPYTYEALYDELPPVPPEIENHRHALAFNSICPGLALKKRG
jgi:hypothetical protein